MGSMPHETRLKLCKKKLIKTRPCAAAPKFGAVKCIIIQDLAKNTFRQIQIVKILLYQSTLLYIVKVLLKYEAKLKTFLFEKINFPRA